MDEPAQPPIERLDKVTEMNNYWHQYLLLKLKEWFVQLFDFVCRMSNYLWRKPFYNSFSKFDGGKVFFFGQDDAQMFNKV